VEEQWLLIEELWQKLASKIEGSPADVEIVELIERRYSRYVADPFQASPAAEAFKRLAARKQT
jgi:putative addiction module component (TIGR02574 family)